MSYNNTQVLLYLTVVITWLTGIVIAKGAISTTVAVIFPPYAWYLLVELLVNKYLI